MRYLKTFEKFYSVSDINDNYSNIEYEEIDKYWILPNDKRFLSGLRKINCPEIVQKTLNKERKNCGSEDKFIIVYFSSQEDYDPWRIASYYHRDIFESYEFGGFICIEDYELDADKYNI